MRAQMKPSGMQRLHLKSVPSFSPMMTRMSRVKVVLPGMQKPTSNALLPASTDADELPDGPLRVCGSAVQWNSQPC